ncbi:MAG: metal-dependent hydrolase [Hyphomicrobiaceae bacterium]
MANFSTHIGVGALASGLLGTLTLAADIVSPENVIAVTLAGVLGSVLPDIDLKDSRPSRAMFSGLAFFFAFVSLFLLVDQFSIAELWLIALGVFLIVRYLVFAIFHRMSYHRGIYHSILAAVFFAFVTAAIYKYLLKRPDGVAWLAATFMFIGYLVHLTLDEIYSVDVMDTRLKASFGTALKLFDGRHPGHSIAMAIAVAAAFMVTPPTRMFVEGMSSRPLWTTLQQRLLPQQAWFGIDMPLSRIVGDRFTKGTSVATPPADSTPASSRIETGTLPDQPKSGK